MNPELMGLSAALGVAVLASITDIRARRIPNALVLVGLVITAAMAAVGSRWADALIGSGVGMAVLGLPRLAARDAVGLGDIKLVGVLGLSAGMAGIIVVLAVAVAAATPVVLWVGRGSRRCRQLPLAPFLATGVVGSMAVRFAAGGG